MIERIISKRSDAKVFIPITTRWDDNDIYGHVNNVVYYSFFDTAVNQYLISKCGLDIHRGQVIGLVVQSQCTYHAPIAYPDDVEVGLRLLKLGTSSVTYKLSLFKRDEEDAVADASFTHVFVDRDTRKPQPMPQKMRDGLSALLH